jgi:hypothetical protein
VCWGGGEQVHLLHVALFNKKFLKDCAIQITAEKHFQWMEYAAGASCLLNLFRSRHKNKMQTICVLIKTGPEWGLLILEQTLLHNHHHIH